jgi:prophage maintenance system killer protein
MSSELTFSRFVLIVAEERDASADEVEPTISKKAVEEALTAPFGGPDELVLYSDPILEAALCCVELIRRRPLHHDNKRVAYKCLHEMLVRHPWAHFEADSEKVAEMLDGLGDESKDEDEFVDWVRAEAGVVAWLRYQQRGGPTA